MNCYIEMTFGETVSFMSSYVSYAEMKKPGIRIILSTWLEVCVKGYLYFPVGLHSVYQRLASAEEGHTSKAETKRTL